MFNFFKKKNQAPSFSLIEEYKDKDKYFVRTLQWDWLTEDMIHVFDNKSEKPRMITMDPWPQQVFLDADGTRTIKEYIHYMATLYAKNKIPPSLDKEIIEVIKGLVEDGEIIKLEAEATTLPYKLKLPLSKQETDKA